MGYTKQKRWTRQIIKHFEANGFHPVDVQYDNGYFIFEHGKDMVVHFHIKECKGWLFGIWWNLDGEKSFDFFAQYERDIDKFKPTASTLVKENLPFEDWYLKDLVEMCRFIKKHPYRAWGLDQSHTHDIWEWGMLDGCFKWYWKTWWELSFVYPRVHNKMNKRYLKLVNAIADAHLVKPEIIDLENGRTSSAYPKYLVKCSKFKSGEIVENGWYKIKLKDELDPCLFEKVERYNKKIAKLKKKYWQICGLELGECLGVYVRNDKKGGRKK